MLAVTLVGVLSLGGGVNVALYLSIDAVLLRPPPLPDHTSLVLFESVAPTRPQDRNLPLTAFFELQDILGDSVQLAAYLPGASDFVVAVDDLVTVATSTSVTDGIFEVLSVQPIAGRWPNLYGEVIAGERFWRRVFGDPAAFEERVVSVEGAERFRVVGVMPRRVGVLDHVDLWGVWHPVRPQPGSTSLSVSILGRLPTGRSVEDLREQIRAGVGGTPSDEVNVGLLVDGLRRGLRVPILASWLAINLVLAIVLVTLGTAVAMRYVEHKRENLLRRALGASRKRLVWEWFIDTLVPCAVGTCGAILVAHVSLMAVRHWTPQTATGALAGLQSVRTLPDVLILGLGIGTLAAAVVTFVPLVLLSRAERGGIQQVLSSTVIERPTAARMALPAQLTATIMLMSAALAILQEYHQGAQLPYGFTDDDRAVVHVRLPRSLPSEDTQRFGIPFARYAHSHAALLTSVGSQPGVESVASISTPPLLPGGPIIVQASAEGLPSIAVGLQRVGGDRPLADLGIPVLAGRSLNSKDRLDEAALNETASSSIVRGSAVISEALAVVLGGPQQALGKRLTYTEVRRQAVREIVGVVGDISWDYNAPSMPTIYVPSGEAPHNIFWLVITPRSGLSQIRTAVDEGVRQLPPGHAHIVHVTTMASIRRDALAVLRFSAWIGVALGSLAIVLCVIATAATTGAAARRRARDIAIRVALGASSHQLAAFWLRSDAGGTLGAVTAGALLSATAVPQLAQSIGLGGGMGIAWYAVPPLGLLLLQKAVTLIAALIAFGGQAEVGQVLRSE